MCKDLLLHSVKIQLIRAVKERWLFFFFFFFKRRAYLVVNIFGLVKELLTRFLRFKYGAVENRTILQ